jgi:type VI secretion system secreted protein VgrG
MSFSHLSIAIPGLDPHWMINSCNLRQSYNDHHFFDISAVAKVASKGKSTLSQDSLVHLLGQNAHINIRRDDGKGGVCDFEGFVDQVLPVWTDRACHIRIQGYSKTMWMDCGPHFRSFSEQEVPSIVQKIVGNYKMPISFRNAKGHVDFSVQSQETDYRYLCRLAESCGNTFFYDGIQLHLGSLDHETSEKISLEFGHDIKHVSLSLNTAPLSFQISGYQLESNGLLHQSSGNQCSNADNLASIVAQCSYATYPNIPIHIPNVMKSQNELKRKADQILSKQANDLVRLQGVTNLPGLKIGSKIKIKGTKEVFAQSEYVVIEVNHSVGNDRAYSNRFTAVPVGCPYPLLMQNYQTPLSAPIMATVKAHNDPLQYGRVKVQFIGDEEKSLSPWLRVLTTYTGFGGMYFLPEKEDQVLVFAEDFNIEKSPFVLPAFFHGKATAQQWYDPENKKKGFATEKISFRIDDRTGKLYIEADEIEMVSRNKMKLDGGEKMNQVARVIETEADQNMVVSSGNQMTIKGKRIDLNP